MARVTVEDCTDKVDSPYELVLVAKERATQLNSGIAPTLDRANDKNTDKGSDDEKDELYNKAVDIIKAEGKASTSFLQRKLQIGYNRAARIIDMMEENGEVSKANHVGKREVLK